jgi:protein required for attachment to host cells
VDGERSTRRARQAGFARRIADEIERARKAGKFDRLVLMCGARMLGLLREAMSASSRELVLVEVPKDMAQHDEPAIRAHVPQETWRELGR